uniref:Ig-like domain-containing protein n=1 Tax=Labrus bergylta TaxID=56723 RepID=A0A3Q3G1V6_9LABR
VLLWTITPWWLLKCLPHCYCPQHWKQTQRFMLGHIQWLKEGKPLVVSFPHLTVTSQGYMKIQQVRASDAGIYTCVAGQANEHFVLQIIGSKRRDGRLDVSSPGDRFQELPVPLNQYDNLVEQLLELKGNLPDEKDVEKLHSSEKNRSTKMDERVNSELSSHIVLIADPQRLDEIMDNLSEGLGGLWRERLITQLLSELTTTEVETNESTLHPPETAESSTQQPLLHKPNIKTQVTKPRSPVIVQRPRKVGVVPLSDMIVYVGVPVLLQKPIASLELRCEAQGNPDPSLTWTRNGKDLTVGLLPTGSLKIQSPTKVDEGLYTCTARNRLGSSSLSSWLQITVKTENITEMIFATSHTNSMSTYCHFEFVLICCHVVQFKVICVVLLRLGRRYSGKAFFSAKKHTHTHRHNHRYTVSFYILQWLRAESEIGNVRSVPQLRSSLSHAVLHLLWARSVATFSTFSSNHTPAWLFLMLQRFPSPKDNNFRFQAMIQRGLSGLLDQVLNVLNDYQVYFFLDLFVSYILSDKLINFVDCCPLFLCGLRWRMDPWSPCSASCGGGSQTRSVRCMKGPEGRSREVESQHCLSTGRRPSLTRTCNVQPCARWATTHWGLCHGQCVGPSLATQHPTHQSISDNFSTLFFVCACVCVCVRRPSSMKNCSTETCALYWRVGQWTQCTATCGRHGFQSRQVTCAHRRSGKATREHQCMWRPRPPSWQRCNILSCGRGERGEQCTERRTEVL